MTLEERMKSFLSAWPDSMSLDLTGNQSIEHADFYLSREDLVIEIKNIEVDTTKKIPDILKKHGIGVGVGRFVVDEIVTEHPECERIMVEVSDAMFTSIESAMRKANRQIRQTQKESERSASAGVMVLLNDNVPDLHPNLLMRALDEKIGKRKVEGAKFPAIQGIWVISEVFPPELPKQVHAFVGFVPNPYRMPVSLKLKRGVNHLNRQWELENRYPKRRLRY